MGRKVKILTKIYSLLFILFSNCSCPLSNAISFVFVKKNFLVQYIQINE